MGDVTFDVHIISFACWKEKGHFHIHMQLCMPILTRIEGLSHRSQRRTCLDIHRPRFINPQHFVRPTETAASPPDAATLLRDIAHIRHTQESMILTPFLRSRLGTLYAISSFLGLVWGINRGHQTERRVLAPRPSNRKGRQGERVKVIRSVVREVAGFAPYERRAMELIRNSKDKRARKFIKRRVGTLRRAKNKMESLTNVIAEQRRAGH